MRTSPGARMTLDRFMASPTHYWVVMISDVVWALAFLYMGWQECRGTPWRAAVAIAGGYFGWGLLEYLFHRYGLHAGPAIARRNHARHHASADELISTPILVVAAGALALRGLLGLVLPSGLAWLAAFGVYAGYNYFALFHHFEHHQGVLLKFRPWRTLAARHLRHHKRPHVNYGITTLVWDRVFGTYERNER